MAIPIHAPFVEHIHDVLVGTFLPFDEIIQPGEYRSIALIESAVGRPFQTAFSQEVWPTLALKAAALFHALACNHCFLNGNKRTAVIALDIFLVLNNHMLVMSSEEVYSLAKETVQAKQRGLRLEVIMSELANKIDASMIDIAVFNAGHAREIFGDQYGRIQRYVQRMAGFATTLSESIGE